MSDNRPEVIAQLNAIKARLDVAVQLATKDITGILHKTARDLLKQVTKQPIGKDENGRKIYGGHIGGPNTPPNRNTGTLWKSTVVNPIQPVGFGYYSASISSGAPYAYELEFGYNYPYMNPARQFVIDRNLAVRAIRYRVEQAMKV